MTSRSTSQPRGSTPLETTAPKQRVLGLNFLRLCISFVLAYFLTAAITNCVKLPIGRLRPNFVKTCWPTGNMTWEYEDSYGGYPKCLDTVSAKDVKEIHKSFPSGHSSLSASGLGFLTFWLLGQLHAYSPSGEGQAWRFLLPLLPSFGAVVVAVTRVTDYWHFPSDVLAGLFLGFITSFVVYRTLYPPLTHQSCDVQKHELARDGWEPEPAAVVLPGLRLRSRNANGAPNGALHA